MASTNTSLLLAIAIISTFLSVESHLIVSECPSGTPSCSHGRCILRTGWDDEGGVVYERRCICERHYYGEACTLYVNSEFSNPEIISGQDISFLSLNDVDEEDSEVVQHDRFSERTK